MAKGRRLVDLPLVREQLVDVLCELEAGVAIGFECAAASRRDDGERLRRILVPAAKVRLCRFGIEAASFAVEVHGGNGYCEDWGLTRQLRDAQCHPIWEGTENICALDVLRAVRRERAHEAAIARIDACLDAAGHAPALTTEAAVAVALGRRRLASAVDDVLRMEGDRAEAGALRLTAMLVDTVSAALLLERAAGDTRKGLVALRYARRHLAPRPIWHDRIAADAGREMLAYERIDDGLAAKAADA